MLLSHEMLAALAANAKPLDCGRAHVSAYTRHVNARASDLMLQTMRYDVVRGFYFEEPEALTPQEAAQALGVSPSVFQQAAE